jgi:hypothetical protein
MFCIVAFVVLAILSIFSATHRPLVKESWACVVNRVTFRPCDTGFKERTKSKILGALLKRSTFWARFFKKYYEVVSWIFFLLMLWSVIWAFLGIYRFYVYGSCNGLNDSSFCAFDPSGGNNKTTEADNESCGLVMPNPENVTLENSDLSVFPKVKTGSENEVVLIGCYGCDYTRETYSLFQRLLEEKNPNYTFAHFPVKGNSEFLSNVGYCVEKEYGDKFWEFNDYLFITEKDYALDPENTNEILAKFGFDVEVVNECRGAEETITAVEAQLEEIKKMKIYGTPTIFVDGKPFIGPKPYRVYKSAINKYIFF